MRRLTLVLLFVCSTCAAGADAMLELTQLGYVLQIPEQWVGQPPSSSFRLAQYVVPGSSGGAECIFFHFGPGQGGSLEANIERWRSQFRTPDGGQVVPTVRRERIGNLPVSMVEMAGSYARGVGTGPQGMAKPEQILRVAFVETQQGNLVIQLHGSAETVNAQRAAFDAMVRSMGRRG